MDQVTCNLGKRSGLLKIFHIETQQYIFNVLCHDLLLFKLLERPLHLIGWRFTELLGSCKRNRFNLMILYQDKGFRSSTYPASCPGYLENINKCIGIFFAQFSKKPGDFEPGILRRNMNS